MSSPDQSPSSLPTHIVALAAAGVLTLTGCVENHTPSESVPPTPGSTQATSEVPISLEDALKRIQEGICSKAGAVAVKDCLELPKVTDGATFVVITEGQDIPQASTNEVDETRKVAQITKSGNELTSLSKDYQAAITYVIDNPYSKEAVRQGTRIVFEQQEDEAYYSPMYVPKADAIRIQLFSGKNDRDWAFAPDDPSIGEIRATLIHESSHALQEKWQKNTKLDKEISESYHKELMSAMEWIRTANGLRIKSQLDKFERALSKDFKQKDISKQEYKALLENSRTMKKMLQKKNGFALFAVNDPKYGPYFNVPNSVLVGEDYPERKDYEDEMKIGALDVAGSTNDIFRQYLADYFSYGVEYKALRGLLDEKNILGHGWDNPGEFIASMTALVEVSPGEVVSAVNGLSSTHKERVARLIGLIAEKYKTENPSVFETSNYPTVINGLA